MLTINGGTFSGGLNTIKNDDYGELVINDGTFTSMSQAAFLNWNVATVNGGTFDAAGASNGVILNGYIDGTMDQGKLTINGGTFNAGEKTVITTMGGGTHSGDIEITGGTLRAQPEEVRAVCLLPLEEAQRRLTYAADKELLEKAKNMILDEKNG